MKIAIVTAFPPSKVMLNEYAYHLVEHFVQKDKVKELILLTDFTETSKDLSFTTNGCYIKVKQCWRYNSYKNVYTILKALKKTTPDAVLFNMQFMRFGNSKPASALGLFLPLACKIKKIPSVVLLHNILECSYKNKVAATRPHPARKIKGVYNYIKTRLVLQADKVVLTNSSYIDLYKDKYKATNLHLIPHGSLGVPEEPVYKEYSGTFRLLTYGKWGSYKRLESLVLAFNKVKERTGLPIELVIAGTDSPETPGYLYKMKKEFKSVEGLMFVENVETYEVPALFKNCDAVVMPYTFANVNSGALQRAGSFGKPIIIPNLKEILSVVEFEGYEGVYYDAFDTESMADGIEKVLVYEDYRRELGKANFEAASRYPMSKIADMYISLFNHLITPPETYVRPMEKVRVKRNISVID